jgi:hypothetical protein
MTKKIKFPGCNHICDDLTKELLAMREKTAYRCGTCKKTWVAEWKKSKTFRKDPKASKVTTKTGAEILKHNK